MGIQGRCGDRLFVRTGSGSGRRKSLCARAAIRGPLQDTLLQHEGGELRKIAVRAIIMVGGAAGISQSAVLEQGGQGESSL